MTWADSSTNGASLPIDLAGDANRYANETVGDPAYPFNLFWAPILACSLDSEPHNICLAARSRHPLPALLVIEEMISAREPWRRFCVNLVRTFRHRDAMAR
jgi:hypothetical protein